MLSSFLNKGFTLTFKNGHTVSVQFGPSNYCDKQSPTLPSSICMKTESWKAGTAEVAAWDATEDWVTRNYPRPGGKPVGEVIGHLDADEVADFIAWVQSLPKA
jgi:hypothetical protein